MKRFLSIFLATLLLMTSICVSAAEKQITPAQPYLLDEDFNDVSYGPFSGEIPSGMAGVFSPFNEISDANLVEYMGTKGGVYDKEADDLCYASIVKPSTYSAGSAQAGQKLTFKPDIALKKGDKVEFSFDFATNDPWNWSYVTMGANANDKFETNSYFEYTGDGKNTSGHQYLFMYRKNRIHTCDNMRLASPLETWHTVKFIIDTCDENSAGKQTMRVTQDDVQFGYGPLKVNNSDDPISYIGSITFHARPWEVEDQTKNLEMYFDNIKMRVISDSETLNEAVLEDETFDGIGDLTAGASGAQYFGNFKFKAVSFGDALTYFGPEAGNIMGTKKTADDTVFAVQTNADYAPDSRTGAEVQIIKSGVTYTSSGANYATLGEVGLGDTIYYSTDIAMTAPRTQRLGISFLAEAGETLMPNSNNMRYKMLYPYEATSFSNLGSSRIFYIKNGNICGPGGEYINAGFVADEWNTIAAKFNTVDKAYNNQQTMELYLNDVMLAKYILDTDKSTTDVIEPIKNILELGIRAVEYQPAEDDDSYIATDSEIYFDNIRMEVKGNNVTGDALMGGEAYNRKSNTFGKGKLTATYAVVPEGDCEDAQLIMAQYVGNKLVKCGVSEKTVTVADREISVDMQIEREDGYVKLFLFENGTIRPLKSVAGINYAKNITLFVAGDSLGQDYNKAYYPMGGWGMYIGDRFNSNVKVVNTAFSGRRTTSFYDTEWQQIKDMAKPGDYVMLALMHNDFTNTSMDTYGEYLGMYADDAKEMGINLIFITSPNMASLEGTMDTTDYPYVQTMKSVAAAKGVICLDIYGKSLEVFNQKGLDWTKQNFFMYDLVETGVLSQAELNAHPLATVKANADNQHMSWYGATLVCQWIAQALEETNDTVLKNALKDIVIDDLKGYAPSYLN